MFLFNNTVAYSSSIGTKACLCPWNVCINCSVHVCKSVSAPICIVFLHESTVWVCLLFRKWKNFRRSQRSSHACHQWIKAAPITSHALIPNACNLLWTHFVCRKLLSRWDINLAPYSIIAGIALERGGVNEEATVLCCPFSFFIKLIHSHLFSLSKPAHRCILTFVILLT